VQVFRATGVLSNSTQLCHSNINPLFYKASPSSLLKLPPATRKGSRELCAWIYQTVTQIRFTLSVTRAHLLTQSWKSICIRLATMSFSRGILSKLMVGVRGPNLQTSTLFRSKICVFPCPILDPNSIPDIKLVQGINLWPQLTMNGFDMRTHSRRAKKFVMVDAEKNRSLKTGWYPVPSQSEKIPTFSPKRPKS